MPDRPGLIGEASGSSLFLDEIGELAQASQAHLLRVLDHGEYQRLGEATSRHADLRLIAATNRDPSLLKSDLLARLRLRIVVADLEARKEDIPLLARHLMRITKSEGDGNAVSLPTMRKLLEHSYEFNVRELESVLRNEMAPVDLRLNDERAVLSPVERFESNAVEESQSSSPIEGDDLTPSKIQRCLDENNGVLELTWRALGLSNRFALLRLVKKYQLEVTRRPGQTQLRRSNLPR